MRIATLFVLAAVVVVHSANALPHGKPKNPIDMLNATVQFVLNNASLPAGTPLSNTTKYVWDLVPPVSRFLMLNQTQSQAVWNVSASVISNSTRLDWTTVPSSVQRLLLGQWSNQQFLNLTYAKWAFVDASSPYSASTWLGATPLIQRPFLITASRILSQVPLNQLVNTTILKINGLDFDSMHHGDDYDKMPAINGEQKVVAAAIERAEQFLKKYIPKKH